MLTSWNPSDLKDCSLLTDRETGKSRNAAFVTFEDPNVAVRVLTYVSTKLPSPKDFVDGILLEFSPRPTLWTAASCASRLELLTRDRSVRNISVFPLGALNLSIVADASAVHINCPTSTKESDIRNSFAQYGEIKSVNVLEPRANGGYAIVQYTSEEAAKLAVDSMHGQLKYFHMESINLVLNRF